MNRMAGLRDFWVERSARERLALGIAAAVLLIGGVYLLVWEPALASRARLASSLPRLRAQLDDMRAAQREIVMLRKKIAAAPRPSDPLPAIKASAARVALGGAVGRIDALPGGKVVFSAADLDFGLWLSWVESLQREFGIHLDACAIVSLAAPGRVRVEATFAAGSGAAPRS